VDPTRLDATEFANPGLRSDGGSRYTLTVVGRMWRFDVGQRTGQPAELRVPAGSEITFVATSADVVHGFQVEDHNVNLMLIPGQISRKTAVFDQPGTYRILCHEYCGPGHHTMVAAVVVE
jgi:cytochrome c oxidase subunit 2